MSYKRNKIDKLGSICLPLLSFGMNNILAKIVQEIIIIMVYEYIYIWLVEWWNGIKQNTHTFWWIFWTETKTENKVTFGLVL